jgi:hypothetical protein
MTLDQIFVLALLALVFISFVREFYPPEVTALAASAALLATGIVGPAVSPVNASTPPSRATPAG